MIMCINSCKPAIAGSLRTIWPLIIETGNTKLELLIPGLAPPVHHVYVDVSSSSPRYLQSTLRHKHQLGRWERGKVLYTPHLQSWSQILRFGSTISGLEMFCKITSAQQRKDGTMENCTILESSWIQLPVWLPFDTRTVALLSCIKASMIIPSFNVCQINILRYRPEKRPDSNIILPRKWLLG